VPRCIVLDIDDTDDAVHGQQQLALFNTHAGGYCFQPIKIFEATTGRPCCHCCAPWQAAIGRGGRANPASTSSVASHRNWPAVEIIALDRDRAALE